MSLLTGSGRRITSVATASIAERLNTLHDQQFENPCATAWLDRTTIAVAALDGYCAAGGVDANKRS